MNKDISAQFLCKDCANYNLCEYYHKRKKDSYICKYFHLSETPLEMLDKIRAEIEALPKVYPFVDHIDTYVKEDDVRKILDKYKAESEEEENESNDI